MEVARGKELIPSFSLSSTGSLFSSVCSGAAGKHAAGTCWDSQAGEDGETVQLHYVHPAL